MNTINNKRKNQSREKIINTFIKLLKKMNLIKLL